MTKTTKIYLLICIAVLLYGLFGCKQKEPKREAWPEQDIMSLRKFYDSVNAVVSYTSDSHTFDGNIPADLDGNLPADTFYYTKRERTLYIDTVPQLHVHGDVHWLKSKWVEGTAKSKTSTLVKTDDMSLNRQAGSVKLGGTLSHNTTIDTFSSMFFRDTGGIVLTNLTTTYDVVFYSGGEMVAYRKPDSAWVFINPDKTIQILDSLYKRCK